ncbi:MAG: hypothetical protein AMQ74_01425 [Candidatus Methanofastidiosum methylothiophilum]|uniref:Uncharacterized protein n=1 Tax=Candidatus Methanofastidiosum methylothiophilum TaxID=1705564 RepID=A0A150IX25_9EURY|nr:MAG: hypothetical protein AMQ74_01425 [Candidatus Methanofastidiosum methylthiophilus]
MDAVIKKNAKMKKNLNPPKTIIGIPTKTPAINPEKSTALNLKERAPKIKQKHVAKIICSSVIIRSPMKFLNLRNL